MKPIDSRDFVVLISITSCMDSMGYAFMALSNLIHLLELEVVL